MCSRISLFALLLIAVSLAVPGAAHAAIPFFGPIIDKSWVVSGTATQCTLGWGALVLVVNNLISLLITIAIIFVAPLMIAYSGFLFVVNPVDPSGIAKAKSILTNTIVGIVIALAGWMIVDAIMVTLYNASAPGLSGISWSSLITSGGQPPCVDQKGVGTGLSQVVPGVAAGAAGVVPPSGTGACNPTVLQQIIPSISQSQANTFACLAGPESSCGNPSKNQNGSWNKDTGNGRASTAYGPFQVVLSSNHTCFENQTCYQAAGVSGPLNCQNGFSPQGFTAGGNPTILSACMTAAANLACNFSAAVCVQKAQGFGAWTVDPSGAVAQKQCVAQYAGS